jgi:hypothetical protein
MFEDGYVQFLVHWVRPGSPADEAGLKRGTWITKFNGANISEGAFYEFVYRLYYLEGGTSLSFTVGRDTEFNLEAVTMTATPILCHEVIETGEGTKTAYLLYNDFEQGEAQGNAYEFDNELRTVFGEFNDAGVTELVLDLRYNPGGYVSSCQVLSSLVGDVTTSDVFCKLKRNATIKSVYPTVSNPEVVNFLDEPNSLDMKRVYILGTKNSASSSEMLINALRGVDVEVILIGTHTDGKNVGMDLRDTRIGQYRYEMLPISFKMLNAKDFCDYAGGFAPNIYKDEFYDLTTAPDATGVVFDLGDPRERLLATALARIDGQSVTPDTRATTTRTDGSTVGKPMPAIVDTRRGGAKYIPQMQQ